MTELQDRLSKHLHVADSCARMVLDHSLSKSTRPQGREAAAKSVRYLIAFARACIDRPDDAIAAINASRRDRQ